MNLTSLEYVLAVAKQHSFTRAAKSISLSQQGLSKSIKHLEDELGFKLLDRSGKQVVLSADGKALVPEIEEVLQAYAKLRTKAVRLRNMSADRGGPIHVFATSFFSVRMMSALQEELSARHLQDIIILEEDTHTIIERIRDNPSDSVAIINALPELQDSLPEDGSIVFEPLFSITAVIAASTKLVSPRQRVLTKKELKTLPLAYYNEPVFNESAKLFLDYYQPGNVISHVSNMDTLFEMAIAGRAAMISDTLTAYLNRDRKDLIFFPIDKPISNNVGFLYSGTVEIGADQRHFLEAMRASMEAKWENYIKRHPPVYRGT